MPVGLDVCVILSNEIYGRALSILEGKERLCAYWGGGDDVVLLGDSTIEVSSMAMCSPDRMVNLALGGSTAVDGYYMLKEYIKHRGKPGRVIIGYTARGYTPITFYLTLALYTDYLSVMQLCDVLFNAIRLHDPYIGKMDVLPKALLYKIRFPSVYAASLKRSGIKGRKDINTAEYKRIARERGWITFTFDAQYYGKSYLVDWDDFSPNAVIDFYIHRILKLCKECGIPLMLVQTPIENNSLNEIKSSVRSKYEGYFMQLQKEYPMFEIETSILGFDNRLFGERSHVNVFGARVFTMRLLEKIKRRRVK